MNIRLAQAEWPDGTQFIVDLNDRLNIEVEGMTCFRAVSFKEGELPRACLYKLPNEEIPNVLRQIIECPAHTLDLLRMSKERFKFSINDKPNIYQSSFIYVCDVATWDSTQISEWIVAALLPQLEHMEPKQRAYTVDCVLQKIGRRRQWLEPYRRQAFNAMCKRALSTSMAIKKKIQARANDAPPASLP